MNSLDILMYVVFTVVILYFFWMVLSVVWLGIIAAYHVVSDEISHYKRSKRIRR